VRQTICGGAPHLVSSPSGPGNDPGGSGALEVVPSTPSSLSPAVGAPEPTQPRRFALTALEAFPALAVLVALLAVPLVVALVSVRDQRWYPISDLALTELRVRDVFSRHTPLVGAYGRMGPGLDGSNHPGPLGFWAMAPAHRLAGGSAWGLQVGSVSVQVAGIATVLWMAHRRRDPIVLLTVAAGVALLSRAYGPGVMLEGWNPYLPLLWWFAFLLAVWGLLEGDAVALPVAVLAGTFCVQNHVSYGMLVAGLGSIGVAGFLWALRKGRATLAGRPRLFLPVTGAVGGAVLTWIPVVYDQLFRSANLGRIWRHLSAAPSEPPIGFAQGLDVMLIHANPWRLVTADLGIDEGLVHGARWPGALLLAAWTASAVAVWRQGLGRLARLHIVVGVALLLGWLAASRITGGVFFWFTPWAWGTAVAALVAIAATLAALASPTRGLPSWPRAGRVAAAAAIMLVAVVAFTIEATRAEPPSPQVGHAVGQLSERTVESLQEVGSGPYLVTFADSIVYFSSAETWGVINELDRHGIDTRVLSGYRSRLGDHRARPWEGVVEIHVAVGNERIDRWRASDAVEIAATPAGDERFRARLELVEGLRSSGLLSLVPAVEGDDFVRLQANPRVARRPILRPAVERWAAYGPSTAIFLADPVANGDPPGTANAQDSTSLPYP
jgi:hypothetical protein